MQATFETLIARNKTVSLALMTATGWLLLLAGGAFGYLLSFSYQNAASTKMALLGVAIGAIIAVVGSLLSYYGGAWLITSAINARHVYDYEDKVLFNVVEEMSIAAGVPMPRVYKIIDDAPNAFATGRDPANALLCITTGLRKKLSRDELQAVIAHEMAHIKNYDIRLMMLIGALAGIIVLLSDFLARHFFDTIKFGPGRRGRSRSSGSKHSLALCILFIALAIVLAWLAPLMAKLLQLAVSREREYLADATAVQLCRNPDALISALRKITIDTAQPAYDNRALEHLFIVNPNPKQRRVSFSDDSVWATHPSAAKRIARLKGLSKNSL